MKNVVRVFVALWYLIGWISHVYLGLFSPDTYKVFGETALFPFVTSLWRGWIFPHITLCALVLAVFEIAVGLLLISKGRWVKFGLALSMFFNACLVVLGLGMVTADFWQSFVMNRLPNLFFIAIQIPLFWASFDTSIPGLVRGKFHHKIS